MGLFRWAGVRPLAAVAVVAATLGVLLFLNDEDGGDAPSPVSGPSTTTPLLPAEDLSTADMSGWRHRGRGGFRVTGPATDPVYVGRGGPGILFVAERLTDFRLDLEFRAPKGSSDSGVFLRLSEPVAPSAAREGVEVQIKPDGTGVTATGAIFSLEPPIVATFPQPGVWHHLRIEVVGDRVSVAIDDVAVNQFPTRTNSSFPPSGYMGLENHSVDDPVAFKAIRLRRF